MGRFENGDAARNWIGAWRRGCGIGGIVWRYASGEDSGIWDDARESDDVCVRLDRNAWSGAGCVLFASVAGDAIGSGGCAEA
jgi:hypothetical protein